MDPRRRALLAAFAAAATLARAHAEERSRLKPIPATGETLPVIGIGTWQTFDVGASAADRAPLSEVLQAFVHAGGRVVDSSPMYGAAESVLGELSAQLKLRERLFLATKVWTRGRAEGARQMQNSLERMRAGRLDLIQVHNLVDVATHTETLKAWKAEQRVRYIGITHYTSAAYAEMERWLGTGQYDFLQINYSLGERESERRLLPMAMEKKVAVIVNRPFAEGALFRRVKGKALPPWAAELGIDSWAQYFLKWIVSHPAVTCAIPATANPRHMRDNLGAGRGALPDAAARKRMADYFDSL
jgi:diketogulonate reductase-like aldo/keto reductase